MMSGGPGNRGSNLGWLRGRELGQQAWPGQGSQLKSMLYSSMDVLGLWDTAATPDENFLGGIFNFDFSTDGTVLVAACEGKGFLVFDPMNYNLVNKRRNAHTDCVNCVRFLDTRSFVTCSDDNTVVLWDLRFLKNSVRSFEGHSNWVKNIEYASSQGLLVTSGFDGAVYTWDINNYAKEEQCKRVFHIEGLMRCKLTPDDSKLVISTSRGYMLIVHDLDLSRLDINMENFRMELRSLENLRLVAKNFTSLFQSKKNRLEFINDFPKDNKAEIIASLQVHPQGWCVASRNTGIDEFVEWTCVHDIHAGPFGMEGEEEEEQLNSKEGSYTSAIHPQRVPPEPGPRRDFYSARRNSVVRARFPIAPSHTASRSAEVIQSQGAEPTNEADEDESDESSSSEHENSSSEDEGENFFDESDNDESSEDAELNRRRADGRMRRRHSSYRRRIARYGRTLQGIMRWVTANMGVYSQFSWSNDLEARGSYAPNWEHQQERGDSDTSSSNGPNETTISAHLNAEQRERAARYIQSRSVSPPVRRGIHRRRERNWGLPLSVREATDALNYCRGRPFRGKPRLIYSQRETNVGRGFIKEQCFSTDGRLIISPWGNGVRLLSFDDQCRELCDCQPFAPLEPRSLHPLRKICMHSQVVLTTRFSPTHPLFVTGSLDGSIAFMTPNP